MTISSSTRKAGPYTGNGITTAFTFSFKVFQASDLYVVRLDTSTLVQTTLVLNTDYTVTLNANQNSSPGGTVTMLSAPSSTQTITITSSLANQQPTDLTNQGGFYPTVINDALDRATILIQQLAEKIARSLTIPLSSTADTDMPSPVANTLIGWDNTGASLSNYTLTDVLTVAGSSGFNTQQFSGTGAQTAFTLSAQPGVIANLEVFISGVRQRPTTDYTLSATTLTFTSAPPAGTDNIFCRWGTTLGIGVPNDDSVTSAKIASGGPSWLPGGTALYMTNAAATTQPVSVNANIYSTFITTQMIQYPSGAAGTTLGISNGSLGQLQFAFTSAGLINTGFAGAPLYFGTAGGVRMKIDDNGNVLSVSSGGGLGYGTGAGGTVTQATSKSTGVTINKPAGQITMHNAALAAGANVEFVVNNNLIAGTDVVVVNAGSGFTAYRVEIRNVSSLGAFVVRVTNVSAGSLSEAVVINFAIIKGVSA